MAEIKVSNLDNQIDFALICNRCDSDLEFAHLRVGVSLTLQAHTLGVVLPHLPVGKKNPHFCLA